MGTHVDKQQSFGEHFPLETDKFRKTPSTADEPRCTTPSISGNRTVHLENRSDLNSAIILFCNNSQATSNRMVLLHTARWPVNMTWDAFGETLISKDIWPPTYPDLSSLDDYYYTTILCINKIPMISEDSVRMSLMTMNRDVLLLSATSWILFQTLTLNRKKDETVRYCKLLQVHSDFLIILY